MTALLPALCPSCDDVVFVDNFTSEGASSVSVSTSETGLQVHAADGLTIKGAAILGGMIVGGRPTPGDQSKPAGDVLVTCPQCDAPHARLLPGLYDLTAAVTSIVAGPSWTWSQLDQMYAILEREQHETSTPAQILEAVQATNAQVGQLLMQGTRGWSRGDVLGVLSIIVSIAGVIAPYVTG